jgi:integrase
MGMDWKVLREWNREDKGPWPLCGSNGGRSLGEIAGIRGPFERNGGAPSRSADKFQGVRRKRLPPATTEKVEGLNRQTTTERFETHLIPVFEEFELGDLTRNRLQEFLDAKARSGLSRSVVSHLRWDLNAIFKMAGEDTIIQGNPAGSLVTPKGAKTPAKRTMSKEDVRLALSALDLRERTVFLLAVLVGMRPGEIFALRWGRTNSEMVEVAERVYRGLPDDPKTERGKRQAALPPDLAADIDRWREISVDTSPQGLVFPSERGTFLSRDNFLRRNIQKNLEKVGLGWVNFQVLRRTQASLGHKEGLDPKVSADQRGHAIGVAIDTYTESDLESRREAVTKLELAFRKPATAVVSDSGAVQGFRGKQGKGK